MSTNVSIMLTSHIWGNNARQNNQGSITGVQKFPAEHCLPSPNVNSLYPPFTLIYT